MDLAFRELGGEGPPVAILHGLFGSSQNWAGTGRRLVIHGRVFAIDLRNHGDSPHARPHSLAACVDDLEHWQRAHARQPLRLIGHSMGGLVAMAYALRHADTTAGVASIDIAPRPYPADHEREIRALRADIGACANRAELDALLAPIIPKVQQRQFLLTNAVRADRGFRWRIDADVLAEGTVSGDFAAVTGRFDGEALLVGTGSAYVNASDERIMRRFFPQARLVTIPGADHWPHVSAPAQLASFLGEFLTRCNNGGPPSS